MLVSASFTGFFEDTYYRNTLLKHMELLQFFLLCINNSKKNVVPEIKNLNLRILQLW